MKTVRSSSLFPVIPLLAGVALFLGVLFLSKLGVSDRILPGSSQAKEAEPLEFGAKENPSVESDAKSERAGPVFLQPESELRPAPRSLVDAYPEVGGIVPNWQETNRNAQTLTVAPYKDLPVTFHRTYVKDEGAYVTWFGTVPGLPGSSMVAVAKDSGSYDAVMIIPGSSQFAFHTDADGSTTVVESQPGEEGCGVWPAQPDRTPGSVAGVAGIFEVLPRAAVQSAGGYSEMAGSDDAEIRAHPRMAEELLSVDVLFVYDATTLAAAALQSSDAAGYIDGLSKAYIEQCNVVLANSGITNFRWRYVGALQSPAFPQTQKLVDDLRAMESNGAIGEWIKAVRRTHAADQVMFWHGDKNADFMGQAHSSQQTAVAWDYALSVAKWGTSYKNLAHELAHNFGCQHDRDNMGSRFDGDGYYCYGERWTGPPLVNFEHIALATAGTIMSYATAIIPYFSNPTLSVQVTSRLADQPDYLYGVYDWGLKPLGRPIGDPRAAYNAKVLVDNARKVSEFSESHIPPVIVTHPSSTSVVVGGEFRLSVVATGVALQYQWFRDDVFLVGGSEAVLSKAGALVSDSGNYRVLVHNPAGSQFSNLALVTVSAASVPPPVSSAPPAPSGSAGKSGGGGAPSVFFLLVLTVLGAGRLAATNRQCERKKVA